MGWWCLNEICDAHAHNNLGHRSNAEKKLHFDLLLQLSKWRCTPTNLYCVILKVQWVEKVSSMKNFLSFFKFFYPLQINGLWTFVHTSVFLATQCIFFFPLRTFSVGQTKSSGCLLFHSSILVLMQLCTFKGLGFEPRQIHFQDHFGVVWKLLETFMRSKFSSPIF